MASFTLSNLAIIVTLCLAFGAVPALVEWFNRDKDNEETDWRDEL